MMRINEATGIMLECTDKTKEINERSLQETSFVWLPPVGDPLVKGTGRSEVVNPTRIPGYVWLQGTNLSESNGTGQVVFNHPTSASGKLTDNRRTEVHIGQSFRIPVVKSRKLNDSSEWGINWITS